MNTTDKAKTWEIAFKIAKKYNVDLTYLYNSKRNIDIYSFIKNNSTTKRLKIEVGKERMNFTADKFDIISNTKKRLYSVCKFDNIKNINIFINDLFEYNDNWEHFVDDLMCHLDFNVLQVKRIRKEGKINVNH